MDDNIFKRPSHFSSNDNNSTKESIVYDQFNKSCHDCDSAMKKICFLIIDIENYQVENESLNKLNKELTNQIIFSNSKILILENQIKNIKEKNEEKMKKIVKQFKIINNNLDESLQEYSFNLEKINQIFLKLKNMVNFSLEKTEIFFGLANEKLQEMKFQLSVNKNNISNFERTVKHS